MSNPITVYWASPAEYFGLSTGQDLSSPLNEKFSAPVKVLNKLRTYQNKTTPSQNSFACPAHNSMLKNVYLVDSVEDYTFNLVNAHQFSYKPFHNVLNEGGWDFVSPRECSLLDHTDVQLNLSWLFFASEPVIVRFTSPYLPAVSPAEGALLMCGEFDIGQWYRPFVLNYSVPKCVDTLTINKDKPLFFMEFKTDKNIIFKQYAVNGKLMDYSNACLTSPVSVGPEFSLEPRYNWLSSTITSTAIIEEIEKRLI